MCYRMYHKQDTQDALRYSSSRSNRKFASLEIILEIHSNMKTSSRPRRAEIKSSRLTFTTEKIINVETVSVSKLKQKT